ncbi:MAG: hypothetical protein UU37_C0003G0029 [Candidatus Gottesmanbacteria bacterium GW2011_GWA2_41_12]|nr:MAG: hypothetical protein UU37_C0003G0029 [Candidatus Gottesmanbacteria bacterium GW2011_GWA2_41_12]
MKRISTFFITALLFVITSGQVLANPVPTPSVVIPTPTPEKINYQLPFPGILPDHPLYFLKTVRDRILDTFTGQPMEKVKFDLLMADKRLAMSQELVAKGKYDLAVTTVSKGEKYLLKSSQELIKLKKENKDISGVVIEKVLTSSMKHQEVINSLMVGLGGEQKQSLSESLSLANQVEEEIGILK